MIHRLVKLTFEREAIPLFLKNFDTYKEEIRNFPGCEHLALWQQQAPNDQVFFTYSHWQSAAHLESYRNSELFKTVWANTKVHFTAKPEAWSLDQLVQVIGSTSAS